MTSSAFRRFRASLDCSTSTARQRCLGKQPTNRSVSGAPPDALASARPFVAAGSIRQARSRLLQPTCQRRVPSFRLAARNVLPTRANIALHGALLTDTRPPRSGITFRDCTSRLGCAVTLRHPRSRREAGTVDRDDTGSRTVKRAGPHVARRIPSQRSRKTGATAKDVLAALPGHRSPPMRLAASDNHPRRGLARARQPRKRVPNNVQAPSLTLCVTRTKAQAHARSGRTSPYRGLFSAHRSCQVTRRQPRSEWCSTSALPKPSTRRRPAAPAGSARVSNVRGSTEAHSRPHLALPVANPQPMRVEHEPARGNWPKATPESPRANGSSSFATGSAFGRRDRLA
jgi:hypothetical protein